MKKLPLTNDIEIPILGFGTSQLSGDTALSALEEALATGYRLIDTADVYGNHFEVGQAIKNSGLKRNEVFLTTKLWRNSLNKSNVLEASKRFLEELQTSYIDLLLIHWPNPSTPVFETLEAMSSLKEQNLVRALGVSNFTVSHLQEALKSGVEISNNQVELHPTLNQKEIKRFCDENKIVVTAYSPLGRGDDVDVEEILALSKKYAKTPGQIILNWITQRGIVAIPKAASHDHIHENFKALDFSLTDSDMELINQTPQNGHLPAS